MKRLSVFASMSVFALVVGCSSSENAKPAPTTAPGGVAKSGVTEIVDRIDLGSDVGGIAIDSASGTAYVAHPRDSELAIVDLKARETVGTIDLPSYPVEVAVDDKTVYVTTVSSPDGDGGQLQFVDRAQQEVVASIDVGRRPRGLVVDDKSAYVPLRDAGVVVIVDKASRDTVARPESSGAILSGIAIDPESQTAYAIDQQGRQILVVENNAIKESISLEQAPRAIAFDSATKRLYVGGEDGSVTVVDAATRKVQATVSAEGQPQGLAVAPSDKRAFYLSRDGVVTVIDTNTNAVVSSFDVSSEPFTIVVDQTSGAIYVPANGGLDVAQTG